ncbi:hypothetical protein [Psychrobacter sp. I-STPA10]|uniref:hypothetical protein n=1 Tax=Psychrobacter sp. I-STPA10 TaxID=2585769 RepID=UPI001E5D3DE3|nr:hypothetical protein [Psychrobacter sp. I-STPA10]
MKNTVVKSIVLILIIIVVYATYPFIFLTEDVKNFCKDLEASNQTLSFDIIIDKAENKGFRFYKNETKRTLLISDPRTIGKFTCTIKYENNILQYTYLDN